MRALTPRFWLLAVMLMAAVTGVAAWQWPSTTSAGMPGKPRPGQDHPRRRAEWFLRDRRALDGRSPAEHMLRAYAQRRDMPRIYPPSGRRVLLGSRRFAAAPAATSGNWTELGPDPQTDLGFVQVSGRVTSLATDLQNDPTGNTVYLGAAYGGVWRSTNALSSSPTWTPISDQTQSLAVGALALIPGTNPPVVIVGTGEQNNSEDSYYGVGIERGVYDSTTSSWNWTLATTAGDACTTAACGTSSSTFGSSLPLLGLSFAKVLVDPANPSVVLAAGGSSTQISSFSLTNYIRGIYRSTDGGQTWTLVFTQGGPAGSNYSCTDLLYDPVNGVLYAALRGHGVYQSSDAGATWSPVATPTPFVNAGSVNLDNEYHRADLAVDGKGDLFTIVTDITGQLATPTPCSTSGGAACDTGIWESPDGGKTWNPIAAPTCGSLNTSPFTSTCSTSDPLFDANNQGDYDMYIAVPPNSSTLVVGGIDVWSATPNGLSTTWSNLTVAYGPGVTHPDQHAIAFAGANTWFVGNDGGIWSTTNAGDAADNGSAQAWTDINTNLDTIQFYGVTGDPSQAGIYTGGSQDNGTVVNTASSGTLWGQVWGGDGGETAIQPGTKNYFAENAYAPAPPSSAAGADPIIVVSPDGGVPQNQTYSSKYGACAWPGTGNPSLGLSQLYNCATTYSPTLDTALLSENGDFYLPYELLPNAPSEMLLATCRLWMGPSIPATADQGWAPVSGDLTTGGSPAGACGSNYVQALAAAPSNPGSIFAVTTDGQVQHIGNVFATIPGTWTNETASPMPTNASLPFGAVAVSPDNPNVAYVGVQGFVAGSSYGHVYMTQNGGGSWTDITGNLPDAPVNAITIDPEVPNDVYIGTDVGVFVATDGGISGEVWQQLGSGLPNAAVLGLDFDTANRDVIAATHGRGAWAIPAVGTPQADFTLTTSNAVVYAAAGTSSAQFTIGATAQGGFTSAISLTCAGCTTTSVNPGGSATVTYTGAPQAGTPVTITGTGGGVSHTLTIEYAPTSFTLNATPSNPSVSAGSSATLTAVVSPQGPFSGAVSLSCPGSGSGIACAVSPSSVQISGGKSATATVTITTTASLPPPGDGGPQRWPWPLLAGAALLAALAAVLAGFRQRRRAVRWAAWLAPLALAACLLALSGCGSSNSAGLPPASGGGGGGGGTGGTATAKGAYSITLQATAGSQTASFPIVLTVQ